MFWFCAVITLVSALTSLVFSVGAVKAANEYSRPNTLYTVARSLALVILAIAPFVTHDREWLLAAAVTMTVTQAADAYVGWIISNRMRMYGPAALAFINLVALVAFARN